MNSADNKMSGNYGGWFLPCVGAAKTRQHKNKTKWQWLAYVVVFSPRQHDSMAWQKSPKSKYYFFMFPAPPSPPPPPPPPHKLSLFPWSLHFLIYVTLFPRNKWHYSPIPHNPWEGLKTRQHKNDFTIVKLSQVFGRTAGTKSFLGEQVKNRGTGNTGNRDMILWNLGTNHHFQGIKGTGTSSERVSIVNDVYLIRTTYRLTTQTAFFIILQRAVIGPSG